MPLYEITVIRNNLKFRYKTIVIPAHEPESIENGAIFSSNASIYLRFRLKKCRNDDGVISIQSNSIFVQRHLKE